MGRLSEAVMEAATACKLDPLSPFAMMDAGFINSFASEFDRARAFHKRALELAPDYAWGHVGLALLSAEGGNHPDAVREVDEAVRLSDEVWCREFQAQVYSIAGLNDRAKDVLNGLLSKRFPGYPSMSFIGSIYYLLGDADTGWQWMQKAYEERDTGLATWNKSFAMKVPRRDPRFVELLRKMRLT